MDNQSSTLSKNHYSITKKSSLKIISNYQLKQTIGKGGFAKVKRATHKLLHQDVAVKIIDKSSLSSQYLQRLKKEIDIHKTMIHQNIVRIYEVYQDQKYTYIFMEHAKNGQLFQKIQKAGILQESQAGKIFCQIYDAVKYMHDQKIMHRDIKVQNIMLDYQMNAKLIDFGLAQKYQKNGQQMQLNTFCGSPAYVPPQIVQRKSYSGSSIDVWCLGVSLYAMLTGQLPFGSTPGQKMAKRILQCNFKLSDSLSIQAQKLLIEIFKHKERRITLQNIQNTEFYKKYCSKNQYNFVNTIKQNVQVDETIVKQMEKKYGISRLSIYQSVKNIKADQIHGIYYLIVQTKAFEGKMSDSDLASPNFKKSQKQMKKNDRSKISFGHSLNARMTKSTTLSPLKKTMENINSSSFRSKRKSMISSKIELIKDDSSKVKFRVKVLKPSVDINKCRLRQVDQSPESPKRLLDCIKNYQ